MRSIRSSSIRSWLTSSSAALVVVERIVEPARGRRRRGCWSVRRAAAHRAASAVRRPGRARPPRRRSATPAVDRARCAPRPSRSSWARVRSSTSQSSPIVANTSSRASPSASAVSASSTGATPSTSATERWASKGSVCGRYPSGPSTVTEPADGPVFTGDQLQQRALAGAVGRDQAGVAVADGEGQLLEQRRFAGPREGQIRANDGAFRHVRALRDGVEATTVSTRDHPEMSSAHMPSG